MANSKDNVKTSERGVCVSKGQHERIVSKCGFYIGDPMTALRDIYVHTIMSNKQNAVYDVDGYTIMTIVSPNGNIHDHEIHNGIFAIIPLELVDKNKLKFVSKDDIDIRLGQNIIAAFDGRELCICIDGGNFDAMDMVEQPCQKAVCLEDISM